MSTTTAPVTAADVLAATGAVLTQQRVDALWASIQASCGWHVAPVMTENQLLDSDGGDLLLLKTCHVTDVLRVSVAGTELTADQYEWSADGMIRRLSGCWPRGFRRVEVSMTHGFPVVPGPLLEVMAEIDERTRIAETAGPFSVQHAADAAMQYSNQSVSQYMLRSRP